MRIHYNEQQSACYTYEGGCDIIELEVPTSPPRTDENNLAKVVEE